MYSRRPNPVFSDEYRVIREAVIQARRGAGLSQAELAARLGKAKSHVAMIERGQRRIDSLELYAMAQAFGLEPAAFFARIAERLDAFAAAAAQERPPQSLVA
jgi:transcriptional regulator with XRE-family HTH domain